MVKISVTVNKVSLESSFLSSAFWSFCFKSFEISLGIGIWCFERISKNVLTAEVPPRYLSVQEKWLHQHSLLHDLLRQAL